MKLPYHHSLKFKLSTLLNLLNINPVWPTFFNIKGIFRLNNNKTKVVVVCAKIKSLVIRKCFDNPIQDMQTKQKVHLESAESSRSLKKRVMSEVCLDEGGKDSSRRVIDRNWNFEMKIYTVNFIH